MIKYRKVLHKSIEKPWLLKFEHINGSNLANGVLWLQTRQQCRNFTRFFKNWYGEKSGGYRKETW